MILKLNTLQQLHPNFSNFPNKLVGGYLGNFRGGVLPGFPTRSLQLGSSGQKKKRAREKDTREGRPHPSRAPVLSFAHYFQAPATQAIQLQTLFQTKTRIFHRPVFRPGLWNPYSRFFKPGFWKVVLGLGTYHVVYSRLSLNGHLYKTDTSVKRTPRVGPCLCLFPLFDSI